MTSSNNKQLVKVVVATLIHVGVVEVHQVRPADGDSGAFRNVHLNRDIRDVFGFVSRGRLDLDEVEFLLAVSPKYVDSCSDVLEGEGGFIECWDGSVRQKGLGCLDCLVML